MPTKFKILRSIVFGLFLLMLLLPLGCERATDLRPEGNGFVVVECVLTQDEKQSLRLTMSEQATEADYERLKKADVRVYDETEGVLAGTFALVKGNAEDGYIWESAFVGVPTHAYCLEIEVEGYGLVTARTTMPDRPHIQCLWQLLDVPNNVNSLTDHPLTIEELLPEAELGVRFLLSSLPEGPVWIMSGDERPDIVDDSATEVIATSILNADSFNVTGSIYYDEQNEANVQGFEMVFLYKGQEEDETSSPSFQRVPHGFFYYVQGQPVHERYIRIPSVREGGHRESKEPDGFFSVHGRFGDTPLLLPFTRPLPNREAYLEMWDKYIKFAGGPILGDFDVRFKTVYFLSLSEEYDLYLRALLDEKQKQERRSDYMSLFDRYNMHSNIESGLGVFGSFTRARGPLTRLEGERMFKSEDPMYYPGKLYELNEL